LCRHEGFARFARSLRYALLPPGEPRRIICAIMESDDLTMLAPGVVDSEPRAVVEQKLIDPRINLLPAEPSRAFVLILLLRTTAASEALARVRIVWIELRLPLCRITAFGRGIEVYRHKAVFTHEHDFTLDLVLDALEVSCKLLLGQAGVGGALT